MIEKVIGVLIGALIIGAIGKNNVTPSNLGVENGNLAPLPNSPNAISSQTDDLNKKVEPLEFLETFEKSKKKILEIIRQNDNAEVITIKKDYVHAVFKTNGLKFKDDVEFYFDIENKKIHFRSASRVGYSDMGVNQKRYKDISKEYYGKK